MNIGKLYTYRHERILFQDENREKRQSVIRTNEPFVILEKSTKPSLIIDLNSDIYKVLTAKGEIGWITGVPKNFQEVSE